MTRPSDEPQEQSRERTTQVAQLVTLAHKQGVELFRDQSNVAFACVRTGQHDETWPVQSSSFRGWLGGIYADFRDATPNVRSVKEAADTLQGEALYRGEVREVFVRFAYEWIAKLERADGRRVFYTISRREVGSWETIDYKTLEADAAGEVAR